MKRPCPKYAHKLFVLVVFWSIWSTTVMLLGPSSAMADPPANAPPPAQRDASLDLPLDLPSPDSSSSQEPRATAKATLFDEIPSVYGAAKYDQKVNEAPAAITIITAEQIKKYGYRDVRTGPGQCARTRLPPMTGTMDTLGIQRLQPSR